MTPEFLQASLAEIDRLIHLYEERYQDILIKREALRDERNRLIVAYAIDNCRFSKPPRLPA